MVFRHPSGAFVTLLWMVTACLPKIEVDADLDGFSEARGDCNDSSAAQNPEQYEQCDGLDNDCDQEIDEGLTLTLFFQDADLDGYGDASQPLYACRPPHEGYVSNKDDCDDANAQVHPGALDSCDAGDLNCTGTLDLPDEDRDGHTSCVDCDDADPSVSPVADELCNGIDDNCDGDIDGPDELIDADEWYPDADGDGYGALVAPIFDCDLSAEGYVTQSGDCDDDASTSSPLAPEYCDGIDQDCDGVSDDAPQDGARYYLDRDEDGYGDEKTSQRACTQPTGYVDQAGDCDDDHDTVYPGSEEVCDGFDNDCDGQVDLEDPQGVSGLHLFYLDEDHDGYGQTAQSQYLCEGAGDYRAQLPGDCNDQKAGINPGASEQCDGIDNDCDGAIDEAGAITSYYQDLDGDGYGDPTTGTLTCNPSSQQVANPDDCNDSDRRSFPGAPEVCDGLDNDCDGTIDEGLSAFYFRDQDGDGYGTEADTTCQAATGYVSKRGDCRDTDVNVRPGATDSPGDGIDQDCGGKDGPQPFVGLGTGSFASLKAALSSATSGDTIWVGGLSYNEWDLSFFGKDVALRSVSLVGRPTLDATKKGRLFVFSGGESNKALLDGFVLKNGYSMSSGGAIYISASSPIIRHCDIIGSSSAADGGAIALSAAAPQLQRLSLSNNAALRGGGISSLNSSTLMLSQSVLSQNTATYDGGGIYHVSGSGSASIVQCELRMNKAQERNGGGMYGVGNQLRVEQTTFSSNTALKGGGGGIYFGSLNQGGLLSHLVLSGNQAQFGGGISLEQVLSTTGIQHIILRENTASGTGGALDLFDADPQLEYVVLLKNSASAGGGVYVAGLSFPRFSGSILSQNTGYNIDDASQETVFNYSDLYGTPNYTMSSLKGSNNKESNPLFLSDIDVHLSIGSPLTNAGYPDEQDADLSRSDMGAYGGEGGGRWDLDEDGYPLYFWPGTWSQAPLGVDPLLYDCDDQDPALVLCP